MSDLSQLLQQTVQNAAASRTPLRICGGGSKWFYAHQAHGADQRPLDVTGHTGIVRYEPTELVITARCGTPLSEIEAALAERGQMLAFEPPYFADTATLGGTIASGLSGPRRPFTGAVRDFVLGCTILNGRGERLTFGGEVMKNVAGYDVSRLMTGALGTLGVLLEVSLKVLPKPAVECTIRQALSMDQALARMLRWSGQSWPLSGLCYTDGHLYARVSGSDAAVASAVKRLEGDSLAASDVWHRLREQRLDFFADERPLWRISLAPAAAFPETVSGDWLLDWGGAQRWLKTEVAAQQLFDCAANGGGHATAFWPARSDKNDTERFQPLSPTLAALHQRIKQAFDPLAILNPHRLYQAL